MTYDEWEREFPATLKTKTWYVRLRRTLDPATLEDRIAVLQSISRLLHTMIRSSRR
jgi:hypothetical protein